ncbi:RNA polymerase sigma factor [uncultured Gimesia sp.]|uniref:RNA polymerase sigma factor n=1 Tax=uncultured Gimesia sp. TaxID=1678688 RepID=UPI0030D94E7F|tara:strand:+ start:38883 stop:39413 length:531 start_codon:yes stop_codon:yes gene_type:complete
MPDKQAKRWSAEIEAVYLREGREIWALLYAQCSDADRAYDALQEAFVRLQSQEVESIRNIRAWVLTVAQNWLRDYARRQNHAARPADFLDNIVGKHSDPSEDLEKEERNSRVRQSLQQLRAEDREVLVLRYALGWSSKRMSIALDTSTSAIDMRLSRARKRLCEELEKVGIDHETV